MITGHVNAKREAVIELTLHGPQGDTCQVEAVLDTGFAGYLTLPSSLITALQLDGLAIGRLILADGTEIVSELFLATIVWDGQERVIEVDTLETEALVGMALMDSYDLHIQVTVGGKVSLTSSSVQP